MTVKEYSVSVDQTVSFILSLCASNGISASSENDILSNEDISILDGLIQNVSSGDGGNDSEKAGSGGQGDLQMDPDDLIGAQNSLSSIGSKFESLASAIESIPHLDLSTAGLLDQAAAMVRAASGDVDSIIAQVEDNRARIEAWDKAAGVLFDILEGDYTLEDGLLDIDQIESDLSGTKNGEDVLNFAKMSNVQGIVLDEQTGKNYRDENGIISLSAVKDLIAQEGISESDGYALQFLSSIVGSNSLANAYRSGDFLDGNGEQDEEKIEQYKIKHGITTDLYDISAIASSHNKNMRLNVEGYRDGYYAEEAATGLGYSGYNELVDTKNQLENEQYVISKKSNAIETIDKLMLNGSGDLSLAEWKNIAESTVVAYSYEYQGQWYEVSSLDEVPAGIKSNGLTFATTYSDVTSAVSDYLVSNNNVGNWNDIYSNVLSETSNNSILLQQISDVSVKLDKVNSDLSEVNQVVLDKSTDLILKYGLDENNKEHDTKMQNDETYRTIYYANKNLIDAGYEGGIEEVLSLQSDLPQQQLQTQGQLDELRLNESVATSTFSSLMTYKYSGVVLDSDMWNDISNSEGFVYKYFDANNNLQTVYSLKDVPAGVSYETLTFAQVAPNVSAAISEHLASGNVGEWGNIYAAANVKDIISTEDVSLYYGLQEQLNNITETLSQTNSDYKVSLNEGYISSKNYFVTSNSNFGTYNYDMDVDATNAMINKIKTENPVYGVGSTSSDLLSIDDGYVYVSPEEYAIAVKCAVTNNDGFLYIGNKIGFTNEDGRFIYLIADDAKNNTLMSNVSLWSGDFTNTDKEVFLYEWNKNGSASATNYIDTLSSNFDTRYVYNRTAEDQKFADQHPFLASTASVLLNSAEGLNALTYSTNQLLNDQPIYSSQIYAHGDTMRAQISSNCNSDIASFLCNTGFSILDNKFAILAGGGIPGVSGVILGLGSFDNSLNDALSRGFTDQQAYNYSVSMALLEAATEAMGIDRLLNMDSSSLGKDVYAKIANMDPSLAQRFLFAGANFFYGGLEQAGAEGLEEVVSSIGGSFIDDITVNFFGTNDNASTAFNLSVDNYMSMGYTEQEAYNMAKQDKANEVVESFASGFLSGFVSGGGKLSSDALFSSNTQLYQDINYSAGNFDKTVNSILGQTNLHVDVRKQNAQQIIDSLDENGEIDTDTYNNLSKIISEYKDVSSNNDVNPEVMNQMQMILSEQGIDVTGKTSDDIKNIFDQIYGVANDTKVTESMLDDVFVMSEMKARISELGDTSEMSLEEMKTKYPDIYKEIVDNATEVRETVEKVVEKAMETVAKTSEHESIVKKSTETKNTLLDKVKNMLSIKDKISKSNVSGIVESSSSELVKTGLFVSGPVKGLIDVDGSDAGSSESVTYKVGDTYYTFDKSYEKGLIEKYGGKTDSESIDAAVKELEAIPGVKIGNSEVAPKTDAKEKATVATTVGVAGVSTLTSGTAMEGISSDKGASRAESEMHAFENKSGSITSKDTEVETNTESDIDSKGKSIFDKLKQSLFNGKYGNVNHNIESALNVVFGNKSSDTKIGFNLEHKENFVNNFKNFVNSLVDFMDSKINTSSKFEGFIDGLSNIVYNSSELFDNFLKNNVNVKIDGSKIYSLINDLKTLLKNNIDIINNKNGVTRSNISEKLYNLVESIKSLVNVADSFYDSSKNVEQENNGLERFINKYSNISGEINIKELQQDILDFGLSLEEVFKVDNIKNKFGNVNFSNLFEGMSTNEVIDIILDKRNAAFITENLYDMLFLSHIMNECSLEQISDMLKLFDSARLGEIFLYLSDDADIGEIISFIDDVELLSDIFTNLYSNIRISLLKHMSFENAEYIAKKTMSYKLKGYDYFSAINKELGIEINSDSLIGFLKDSRAEFGKLFENKFCKLDMKNKNNIKLLQEFILNSGMSLSDVYEYEFMSNHFNDINFISTLIDGLDYKNIRQIISNLDLGQKSYFIILDSIINSLSNTDVVEFLKFIKDSRGLIYRICNIFDNNRLGNILSNSNLDIYIKKTIFSELSYDRIATLISDGLININGQNFGSYTFSFNDGSRTISSQTLFGLLSSDTSVKQFLESIRNRVRFNSEYTNEELFTAYCFFAKQFQSDGFYFRFSSFFVDDFYNTICNDNFSLNDIIDLYNKFSDSKNVDNGFVNGAIRINALGEIDGNDSAEISITELIDLLRYGNEFVISKEIRGLKKNYNLYRAAFDHLYQQIKNNNVFSNDIDSKMMDLLEKISKGYHSDLDKMYAEFKRLNGFTPSYKTVNLNGKVYYIQEGYDTKKAKKVIDKIDKVISKMPSILRNSFNEIYLNNFDSPDDVYWAFVYDCPGFYSAATGGVGTINIFRGTLNIGGPSEYILYHEAGHNLDYVMGNISASAKWNDASSADNGYVSDYARSSSGEDFAESIVDYFTNEFSKKKSSTFSKSFSNRARVLDEIFSGTTVDSLGNNLHYTLNPSMLDNNMLSPIDSSKYDIKKLRHNLIEKFSFKLEDVTYKFVYRILNSVENYILNDSKYSMISEYIFDKYSGNIDRFEYIFGFPMYMDGELNKSMLAADIYSYMLSSQYEGKSVSEMFSILTNTRGKLEVVDELISSYLVDRKVIDEKYDFKYSSIFDSNTGFTDISNVNGIVSNIVSKLSNSLKNGRKVMLSLDNIDTIYGNGLVLTDIDGNVNITLRSGDSIRVVGVSNDNRLVVENSVGKYYINLIDALILGKKFNINEIELDLAKIEDGEFNKLDNHINVGNKKLSIDEFYREFENKDFNLGGFIVKGYEILDFISDERNINKLLSPSTNGIVYSDYNTSDMIYCLVKLFQELNNNGFDVEKIYPHVKKIYSEYKMLSMMGVLGSDSDIKKFALDYAKKINQISVSKNNSSFKNIGMKELSDDGNIDFQITSEFYSENIELTEEATKKLDSLMYNNGSFENILKVLKNAVENKDFDSIPDALKQQLSGLTYNQIKTYLRNKIFEIIEDDIDIFDLSEFFYKKNNFADVGAYVVITNDKMIMVPSRHGSFEYTLGDIFGYLDSNYDSSKYKNEGMMIKDSNYVVIKLQNIENNRFNTIYSPDVITGNQHRMLQEFNLMIKEISSKDDLFKPGFILSSNIDPQMGLVNTKNIDGILSRLVKHVENSERDKIEEELVKQKELENRKSNTTNNGDFNLFGMTYPTMMDDEDNLDFDSSSSMTDEDLQIIMENFERTQSSVILNDEKKQIFRDQVKRYIELSKKPGKIYFPKLSSDGKVIFEEGTLIHGIGRFNMYFKCVDEVLESISNIGILSGQAFGIPEEAETEYCADFFRISSEMTVDDYDKSRNFSVDSYTPFGRNRSDLKSKVIAFVISPSESNKELLSYDAYRNGTVASDMTKRFVNMLPIEDYSLGSAVLFGVPSNCINGIIISDGIFFDIDYINKLIKFFPNCYISSRYGDLIYDPGSDTIGDQIIELRSLDLWYRRNLELLNSKINDKIGNIRYMLNSFEEKLDMIFENCTEEQISNILYGLGYKVDGLNIETKVKLREIIRTINKRYQPIVLDLFEQTNDYDIVDNLELFRKKVQKNRIKLDSLNSRLSELGILYSDVSSLIGKLDSLFKIFADISLIRNILSVEWGSNGVSLTDEYITNLKERYIKNIDFDNVPSFIQINLQDDTGDGTVSFETYPSMMEDSLYDQEELQIEEDEIYYAIEDKLFEKYPDGVVRINALGTTTSNIDVYSININTLLNVVRYHYDEFVSGNFKLYGANYNVYRAAINQLYEYLVSGEVDISDISIDVLNKLRSISENYVSERSQMMEEVNRSVGSLKNVEYDKIVLDNGIECIYEKGTDMKSVIEKINSIFDKMSDKLKGATKKIVLNSSNSNPGDAYWGFIFGVSGFKTAASAGQGTESIILYKDMISKINSSDDLGISDERKIYHEVAHNFDDVMGGISSSDEWSNAIIEDGDYTSNYAKKGIREDFAESVVDYFMNKEQFIKKFPNRTKILEQVFSNEISIQNNNKNNFNSKNDKAFAYSLQTKFSKLINYLKNDIKFSEDRVESDSHRVIDGFITFSKDFDLSLKQMGEYFGDAGINNAEFGKKINKLFLECKTTDDIMNILNSDEQVLFLEFLSTDHGMFLSKLSSEEIKSLIVYTGNGYNKVNNALQNGKLEGRVLFRDSVTGNKEMIPVETIVRNIDSAISKAGGVKEDSVYYRGVSGNIFLNQNNVLADAFKSIQNKRDVNEIFGVLRNFTGYSFEYSGYVSASPGYNTSYAKRPGFPIVLEILTPQGTPGAYINQVSKKYNVENEFLYARDVSFKILDVQLLDGMGDVNGADKVVIRCIAESKGEDTVMVEESVSRDAFSDVIGFTMPSVYETEDSDLEYFEDEVIEDEVEYIDVKIDNIQDMEGFLDSIKSFDDPKIIDIVVDKLIEYFDSKSKFDSLGAYYDFLSLSGYSNFTRYVRTKILHNVISSSANLRLVIYNQARNEINECFSKMFDGNVPIDDLVNSLLGKSFIEKGIGYDYNWDNFISIIRDGVIKLVQEGSKKNYPVLWSNVDTRVLNEIFTTIETVTIGGMYFLEDIVYTNWSSDVDGFPKMQDLWAKLSELYADACCDVIDNNTGNKIGNIKYVTPYSTVGIKFGELFRKAEFGILLKNGTIDTLEIVQSDITEVVSDVEGAIRTENYNYYTYSEKNKLNIDLKPFINEYNNLIEKGLTHEQATSEVFKEFNRFVNERYSEVTDGSNAYATDTVIVDDFIPMTYPSMMEESIVEDGRLGIDYIAKLDEIISSNLVEFDDLKTFLKNNDVSNFSDEVKTLLLDIGYENIKQYVIDKLYHKVRVNSLSLDGGSKAISENGKFISIISSNQTIILSVSEDANDSDVLTGASIYIGDLYYLLYGEFCNQDDNVIEQLVLKGNIVFKFDFSDLSEDLYSNFHFPSKITSKQFNRLKEFNSIYLKSYKQQLLVTKDVEIGHTIAQGEFAPDLSDYICDDFILSEESLKIIFDEVVDDSIKDISEINLNLEELKIRDEDVTNIRDFIIDFSKLSDEHRSRFLEKINYGKSEIEKVNGYIFFDLINCTQQLIDYFGESNSSVRNMLLDGYSVDEIKSELSNEELLDFENFLNSNSFVANFIMSKDCEKLLPYLMEYLEGGNSSFVTINTPLYAAGIKGINLNNIPDTLVVSSGMKVKDIIKGIDLLIKSFGGLKDNIFLYKWVGSSTFESQVDSKVYKEMFRGLAAYNVESDIQAYLLYKRFKEQIKLKGSLPYFSGGFISTSPKFELDDWTDRHNIVLQFLVPSGTPGAYVNQFSHKFYNKEYEVLLGRGLGGQIVDVGLIKCRDKIKVILKCILS